MSSPSKPVDIIASPRQQHRDLLDVPGTPGTPRGVRGTPSTPPVPNISPRFRRSNPDASGLHSDDVVSSSLGTKTATPLAISRSESTKDLDKMSEEAMAKVLRRHLVSKEERQNQGEGVNTPASNREEDHSDSRRISASSSAQNLTREDTEPFPIPYDAPGGDVTCVFLLPFIHSFPYLHFQVTRYTNGKQISDAKQPATGLHPSLVLRLSRCIQPLNTFMNRVVSVETISLQERMGKVPKNRLCRAILLSFCTSSDILYVCQPVLHIWRGIPIY